MIDINAKIERWKKRLLDLGKRNFNLNFRFTKTSTLEIIDPDYESLWEDIVEREKELSFGTYSGNSWGNTDEDDYSEFEDADITTTHKPSVQIKVLRNLKKKAQTFSEEQGINVLYLCFGFLCYTEGRDSYLAPLIMVPVSLSCESINAPYKLSIREDDIVVNPTLNYKLEHEYNITLPEFDSSYSLDVFFKAVRKAVKKLNWKVEERVGLGLLYFAKLSMYRDIDSNHESIAESSLINLIAGNPLAHEQNLPNTTNMDENDTMKPVNTFQVVDADTSQQEAILYAKKGISFVLQGPPGTGKSQTITNIIAEMLAARKKVLFVSEKKAALDVVHKRLKDAGLDDFCLIMHDSKDSKLNIMNQFRNILNMADKTYSISHTAMESLKLLEKDKEELNAYVTELHDRIAPLNQTIFEVNAKLSTLTNAPNVVFQIKDIQKVSSDAFNNMLRIIDRYVHSISSMNDEVSANPWYGCNLTELTHEKSHDIDFNFQKLSVYINSICSLIDTIKNSIGYSIDLSYNGICEAVNVLSLVPNAKNVPLSWILSDELAPLYGEIDACNETKAKFLEIRDRVIKLHKELSDHDPSLNFEDYNILSESSFINTHNDYVSKVISADALYSLLAVGNTNTAIDEILSELSNSIDQYLSLRTKITEKYEKEIFSINPNEILQRFKVDYTWGIFNFVKGQYRSDKNLFKGLLKQVGGSISNDDIISTLTELKSFNEISESLDTNQARYTQFLGVHYKRENTDIQDIKRRIAIYRLLLTCNQEINNLRVFVAENEAREHILKKHYENLYSGIETDWESIRTALGWASSFKATISNAGDSETFIKKLCLADQATIAASKDCYEKITEWKAQYDEIYAWIKSLFDDGRSFDSMLFSKLRSRIMDCLDNKSILQDWVDYRRILVECLNNGLKDVISSVEKEKVNSDQISLAFQKRFYELWLDQALTTHPKVAGFRSKIQNDRIKEFRKLDCDQFVIARARVKTALLNDLSDHNIATNSVGEVAILKKELNKKRRIMPIRKLFNVIPNLVMMLKPCLMMSPLTVSLYLQSKDFNFDTVIFDEASQVCTENAIGAILRAKQVIIAGDSKQLPPTNFFRASIDSDTDEYDEENEENNDVYESLLDEAALMPTKTLLWHYRSRHEHLITFSNRKIYNNNLITFPSNRELGEDVGVQYEYVPNGFYDRGGRKGNVIEAAKVADLVFEHFKKCRNGIFNRSLGVIAFGEAQAQAIEAALRIKRQEDSSLEKYFSEELENPFFIKSLENVQGDERDTIIFSIGYAKDAKGVMYMSFGPLSQAGGERRLNVAITRAKYNVKLVGSILPSDIDTERVTSNGPKLLRSYIDFAQRGIIALDSEVTTSDVLQFDSPFEESVYSFLVDHGYNVKTQVGCSSYRIDLAIRHPKISGCFVLGIECDGATYHSAKSARERDRLRQDVLEGMGWKIYRIWSTDWIKDPVTEGKRLIEAIENAMVTYVSEKDPDVETIDITPDEFVTKVAKEEIEGDNKYHLDEYPSFNDIECDGYSESIKEKIKKIVSLAYPISLDQLYKEMCPDLGATRVTNKIKERVDMILEKLRPDIVVVDNFVLPRYYDAIYPRLAGPRKVDYISTEELAEGIVLVAKSNIPMSKADLIMESVKAFGFNRKTQNILSAFDKAYEQLICTHRISESNDKVEILRETPASKEADVQDLYGSV